MDARVKPAHDEWELNTVRIRRDLVSHLLRLAVTGKNLRRSSHRVAERGIEGDAADLPAMIGLLGETPIRPPAELLLDPEERADERGVAAGVLAERIPSLQVDRCQTVEADSRGAEGTGAREHDR